MAQIDTAGASAKRYVPCVGKRFGRGLVPPVGHVAFACDKSYKVSRVAIDAPRGSGHKEIALPMPDTDDSPEQNLDPLAGVVMYGLIKTSPKAMMLDEVCVDVERNPKVVHERAEVEAALRVLMADELVQQEGDKWVATRAAIRADELAF